MTDFLEENFPFLATAEPNFVSVFKENAVLKRFEPGTMLAREADRCMQLPIVIHGGIRVFKESESGRELTVYRIEEGESCILPAFCILTSNSFPATAQVEGESLLCLIPSTIMAKWIDQHRDWRNYVFSLLSRRMESTLLVLSELAFKRVDLRLMELLFRKASENNDKIIQTTHQILAADLGTAREVVSRILKEMEKEGLVQLSRGSIHIQDLNVFQHRMDSLQSGR